MLELLQIIDTIYILPFAEFSDFWNFSESFLEFQRKLDNQKLIFSPTYIIP